MHLRRCGWTWVCLLAGFMWSSALLSAQISPSAARRITLQALLATRGPALAQDSSDHFWLFSEQRGAQNSQMLDSLEAALTHATKLIGAEPNPNIRVPVIVTQSSARFSPILSPTTKGLRGLLADGSSFIVLVVNDSVRAYSRHEVMHDVSFKSWGATHDGGQWMSEALATFADGKCQGVPNIIVARDLLRQRPQLSLTDLSRDFWALSAQDRHATYVLGASVIEFLWSVGGSNAVRRLWESGDWPSISAAGGSPLPKDLSSAWRSFVFSTAGDRQGLALERLQRNGCG